MGAYGERVTLESSRSEFGTHFALSAPASVQDHLWSKIICIAAEGASTCTEADINLDSLPPTVPISTGSKSIGLPQARLWLMMVDKRFYRLGLQYLYQDVVLRCSTDLLTAAHLLLTR